MSYSEKYTAPVKWIIVSYLEGGCQAGRKFLVNVAEYTISIGLINISIHDPDTKSSNVVMELLKRRTLHSKK